MERSMIKWVITGVTLLLLLIVTLMTVGINNAGYRTFIQYPSGYTWVKFQPGMYLSLFGSTEEYPDVMTLDYDKENDGEATINTNGIPVRYQDGGLGKIYGKDRFSLPTDEDTMIKLHKAFRSAAGLANKLIKPVTQEATNLTAGLMSSEGAYAEQRGTFIQWSQIQLQQGKFEQELTRKLMTDEQGEKVWKNVPVIKRDKAGNPIHIKSDLQEYGIDVVGHQITDWDFEEKTLKQISLKREATMAIITAKANAERAKQDATTAEEKGKANVMVAKYEKEVLKEQAIVDAKREAEVAEIKAKQLVAVATQQKLEAEQKKFAAAEYKQEQILRGEGDGEYKRLVMEADGALAQKLDTYLRVSRMYAQAMAQQKWVPEIQMGASGGESSAANDLISLLTTKAAKDLSLNMSIK